MSLGERLPIIIPRLDDPISATADERDEQLMLLEAARHELDVQWTECLGVADAEGDHHLFGFPSTVAYLKARLSMAGGRARRYVTAARMALRFKSTLSAWKHRLINTDQAELLFAAAERMPDRYPDPKPILIEIAGDHPDETRRVLDYWRSVDAGMAALELEAQLERRRFEVNRRPNGMVAGDFELPSLAGEALLAAIDALMPPPADGDQRTAGQRRADALEDLARGYLEGAESSVVGGQRPHIEVHVDWDALQGIPGGLHETADGRVLDLEAIRMLACESSVSRIVFGPSSEVLDVGRKTRVIPAGFRRAVVARDRHCTWSGCGRSARWSDVHHIVSWLDGGETVIQNLRLLCRYHHTLLHREQEHEYRREEPVLAGAGRRST
jgi:hypothetical protein